MKRSNARLRFLYFIMIVAMLIVVANVFIVSVFKVHVRSNTHLDNYINSTSNIDETIFASRGKIYDANGIIVAQDVETYDIICYMDKERLASDNQIAYVDDISFTSKALAPILEMKETDIYEYLINAEGLYQTELGPSGRNLSIDKVNEIKAIEGLNGIDFRNSYKRYYPFGEAFSPQILGFAKSDDSGELVGQLGVESFLNDELTGTNGLHSYQQDKHGYILPGMYDYTFEATNGYDVHLTLDVEIQEALNDCLQKTMEYKSASRAWGSVVEIDTGKILAWGQVPSYDPNNITSEDTQVNFGSQLAYEPGSVMKAIIYSVAMDLGVYNGDAYFDSGPYCYNADLSRTYSDGLGCIYNVSKMNWGEIPLDYGLIYSSNVATTTLLADYVGEENFEEYLHRYHLYEKVNTDGIYEIPGYTNYGLSPSDNITATYGQGSSTTVLQLLQAYTAIFGNGEMLKPYIIDKIVDPNSNTTIYQGYRKVVSNPIKESTAKNMQDLLRRVVSDENGTCRHYEAKTVNVMGKTGTSEIPMDGTYSEDDNIISCMVGFPYENPKYMIYYAYISNETLYYNYDVKPVPDLIDQIALLKNLITNKQSDDTLEIKKYQMPNLLASTYNEACELLEEYDVDIIKIGDGETIIEQYPSTSDNVYTKQKVFVLTDGMNISLPDFKNWSRKEIIAYWQISNLPISIVGSGKVYEQNLSPSTIVTNDSKIIVKLRQLEEEIMIDDTFDDIEESSE